MNSLRERWVIPAKRIVIKVGSGVLAKNGVELDRGSFVRLVEQMSALIASGKEVVLVSSGAVTLGRRKLGLTDYPNGNLQQGIVMKQALAALGQSSLIQLYEQEFSYYDIKVAQILLTRDVLSNRIRYLNARRTINRLLELKTIPVTNENDTVASDEIRFGDNDNMAALVTTLIGADLLILLSDTEGLYTDDPNTNPDAEFIELVKTPDDLDDGYNITSSDQTGVGTGGMATKVEAAATAARYGVPCVIGLGKRASVVTDILRGDNIGTLFLPVRDPLRGRKAWIGFGQVPSGQLILDPGAVNALKFQGRSLLPSGIASVDGDFKEGDMVSVCNSEGQEFARGLTNYSSDAISLIKGKRTKDIKLILGYKITDEVIHRDDMVTLDPA